MVMNRKGFTTLLDACIFTSVILFSVPLLFFIDVDDPEPPGHATVLMDVIVSTRIGFDRISVSEEHTVTDLTDMLAYSTVTGDPGPVEYVREIVEMFRPGHGFTLSCVYGGREVVYGDGIGTEDSSDTRSVPVSVGGDVTIRLVLY